VGRNGLLHNERRGNGLAAAQAVSAAGEREMATIPPSVNLDEKRAELRRAALEYHELPKPGKIAIAATKQLLNQRDLALAYSPGVAAPCEEIVKDPVNAFKYTARGNLVGVITNGTAVLGLGDIGPLASKPVMEGKGVLFKKFAGVDVFDIEIDEKDPVKLVEVIAALEPTFGAINLEDIKAPDCFYVERELRKRMKFFTTTSTAPPSPWRPRWSMA
jgi:malate dehydrogenase (oxaloacetate-decarboxylating)(NADP+)